jgi:hypothetical protein
VTVGLICTEDHGAKLLEASLVIDAVMSLAQGHNQVAQRFAMKALANIAKGSKGIIMIAR